MLPPQFRREAFCIICFKLAHAANQWTSGDACVFGELEDICLHLTSTMSLDLLNHHINTHKETTYVFLSSPPGLEHHSMVQTALKVNYQAK